MPWTICLPIPKDPVTRPRQICFRIPDLVWPPYWWHDPNPPDPPFVTHPDLDREQVRQLQILATIDEAASKLPAEFSHDVQRSVAAQMHALGQKLGAEIKLSRENHQG